MYSKTIFPKHIQLQTHSLCNLKCTLCPHPMLGLNSKKEILSYKNFKKIIDEATTFAEFQSIVLDLQNEPLLDADLERKISYIKSKRKDVFVGITTNGVSLDSKRMRKLISAGIDRIVVSMNAVNSSEYYEIVKTVRFSKILGNLQQILSIEGASKLVKLSFGITNKNRTSLRKFIKLSDDLGVNYRYFYMNSRIDMIKNNSLISVDDSKQVAIPKSLYKDNKRYEKVCHIPMYSLTVKLDGTVIMCCEDWLESKVFGNVFDSSIQEVWNSFELKEVREKLFSTAQLPRKPCGECESARHLPYPTFESSNDISFYDSGVGFTKSEVDNRTNIIPIYSNKRWWFKNILTGSVMETSERDISRFECDANEYLANNRRLNSLNIESGNFVPIAKISINGITHTGYFIPEQSEIVARETPCLEDCVTINFTIGTCDCGVELLMQGKYMGKNIIQVAQQDGDQLIRFMLWSYGWQQKNG